MVHILSRLVVDVTIAMCLSDDNTLRHEFFGRNLKISWKFFARNILLRFAGEVYELTIALSW